MAAYKFMIEIVSFDLDSANRLYIYWILSIFLGYRQ